MRYLLNFLFSTRLTSVLLFLFAYLIGVATFIENKYDTTTARIEIFRSIWLELILVLLAINFIGNIRKYRMVSEKKWTALLFHLAFVVIIIGAGVTRYFGHEGMMPIREGQTTNVMYSSEPYLNIEISDPKKDKDDENATLGYSQPKLMAQTTDNDFSVPFDFGDKQVEVSYVEYIKNAEFKLYENIQGGTDVLEVVTTKEGKRQTIHIESGKAERVGTVLVSYNEPSIKGAVNVIEKGDSFMILSPFEIPRMLMATQATDTVEPNVLSPMFFRQLHQVNGTSIVFARKIKNAVKRLEGSSKETERGDALTIRIKVGDAVTDRVLFGGPSRVGSPEYFSFMGFIMRASYGSKPINLPFSIRLDDFNLERYPGSDNPSGYKSEVTLFDEEKALVENHSIFMNNVLDYQGYRFFQSSYDPDEMGTRLSVNYDAPGTWITYIGYFMLALGFVLTMTNKNSRFTTLMRNIKSISKQKAALNAVIALMLMLPITGFAGENDAHDNHDGHNHADHSGHSHDDAHDHSKTGPLGGKVDNGSNRIPESHAKNFGKLLVQSADGRFEPINTLALDVMHKIVKKENLVLADGNTFTPEQFLLELMVNGKYFEDKKIIYVSDDSLRTFLGISEGKYASFLDFFKGAGASKIRDYAVEATQKDPSKRNRWDKEIIKVGDKIETFFIAQKGELLTLFPSLDTLKNNKWISIYEEESIKPLVGELNNNGIALQLKDYSYMKLFAQYLNFLRAEDYKSADGMLTLIGQIQRKYTPEDYLPSQSKIDLEISYNESLIFNTVKNYYAYLAIILLILAINHELNEHKKSNLRKYLVVYPMNFFIACFFAVFLYHTYGLIVRWYLTNHAPWSNGYEALIFIAWGTALTGIVFLRYSKIVVAGASLVAFLIVMTAGHENMDPQLTNLVPVLKSYWLVIHVACITTSYAFFGLGAVLGLIVMFMMLFKRLNNAKELNLSISGLTYINEMTVTVGVVLAAVGTFLGGIWANESWGRYWGWDAKETWALIIVLVYAMQLHFRFVPGFMRSKFFFNAFGTIVGFGTVCMTFFGVNFYFSKSIHSYAAGDPPAFPIWLWWIIGAIFALTISAGLRDKYVDKQLEAPK